MSHPQNNNSSSQDPAQQHFAADYARQQIAQIYHTDGPPMAKSAAATPHVPSTEPVATPHHVPAQQPSQAPAEYAHTYAQESQPHDLQQYHQAWQSYYQQYYQRYYMQLMAQQAQNGHTATPAAQQAVQRTAAAKAQRKLTGKLRGMGVNLPPDEAIDELKAKLRDTVETRAKQVQASPHFKPIVTAVVVGLLFLFLQFNRTLTAQIKYYISPGTLTNEGSSIIINPATVASVGPEPRIIIPKINVDVPVVYDETTYDEGRIQKALERGVVHYGTTAIPGQLGNNVIVGHSSNDLFDAGGYKFAFVLIDRLNNGDVFMLHHEGKRYIYKVYNKAVIDPTDFSLINITPDKPVVTLITCTPPGTALKRLLVQAEQISPEPSKDQVAQKPSTPATLPAAIPGNSPTFFERITNVFN